MAFALVLLSSQASAQAVPANCPAVEFDVRNVSLRARVSPPMVYTAREIDGAGRMFRFAHHQGLP